MILAYPSRIKQYAKICPMSNTVYNGSTPQKGRFGLLVGVYCTICFMCCPLYLIQHHARCCPQYLLVHIAVIPNNLMWTLGSSSTLVELGHLYQRGLDTTANDLLTAATHRTIDTPLFPSSSQHCPSFVRDFLYFLAIPHPTVHASTT